MASIYLVNVTGDGLAPATAFRPAGFDGVPFACLMIDEVRAKALIFSSNDTITGTGINNLVTAATPAALRTKMQNNAVTAAKRTAISTWLANGGYQPIPAALTSWWDVVHFVARQVNPAADLSTTSDS